MILDDFVEVKIHSANVEYYKKLGYEIPMRKASPSYYDKYKREYVVDQGKYICVKVGDLHEGSHTKIHVACDICSAERNIEYRHYTESCQQWGYYACNKCSTVKRQQTCLERYGVTNPLKSDKFKKKMQNTCMQKYGVKSPMQVQEVKDKQMNTCLLRYGFKHASQSPEVQRKTRTTNQERYGVDYYIGSPECKQKTKEYYESRYGKGITHFYQTPEGKEWIRNYSLERYGTEHPFASDEIKEKVRNTMLERYGATNTMYIPEFRAKMEQTNLEKYGSKRALDNPEIMKKSIYTRYKNGTTATSKQQEYICNLYNGKLNYPCSRYNLDIAVDDIDIEYDGGGHRLCIDIEGISEEEFNSRELIRDKIVKSNGYKVMRLISKTDKLPSDDILLHILNITREYFATSDHTWIEWDFDNNQYRNAENKDWTYFDFGKLHGLSKKQTAA